MSNIPLQYRLSAAERDGELAKLHEEEGKLMGNATAPNTCKAYAAAWKTFTDWCRDWRCCEPLPASPGIVREFITWAYSIRDRPYSAGSIHLAIMAIRYYHREAVLPDPADESVRKLLRATIRHAARQGFRSESAGKKHLTVEQLQKICGSFSATNHVDVRDRALILLGFASALRRCDIVRLDASHVHFEGGRVRLWVALSKNDQEGAGRDVFMDRAKDPSLCPVRALEAWKQVRMSYFGYFRGPLILRCSPRHNRRLTSSGVCTQTICNILKRRLAQIGENERDYGAHSMRSGMITAADAAGASFRSIMDRTGHRAVSTVMRYVKSARGANPLANVL
jgi:site-specific recombinase XerD